MRHIHLIILSCLFVFLSCGKNGEMQSPTASTDKAEIADYKEQNADTTITGGTGEQGTDPVKPNTPSLVKTEWDKKIVKSATLHLEIKDFKAYSKKLADKVKAHGGYISNEVQNSSAHKLESEVVIRVPVDKFDAAVDDVLQDASKLNEKRITSEDQTREYVDSRSRLEAKKQVRLRYLELLKQARNMSEIIEVQSEINNIQEEIEVVSGRINQINLTAAMSTIHLTYYQVLDSSAATDSTDGFFKRLLAAFVNGWKWIGEFLIGLSSIWPLLLIFGIGGIILKRKLLVKKAV